MKKGMRTSKTNVYTIHPAPHDSKCGRPTGSVSITWELVRNVESPAPPQTSEIRAALGSYLHSHIRV